MRQKRREFVFALECGNAVEFSLQRRQSLTVDRILVHAGGVVIANFLFVSAALGATSGCLFQHRVQHRLAVLRDHRTWTKSRSIARNGIQFAEIPACILREIDARIGRGIDELFVQARQAIENLLSVRSSLALRLCHDTRANRRYHECSRYDCCPSSNHPQIVLSTSGFPLANSYFTEPRRQQSDQPECRY